jgi:hypothetical protein
MSAGCAPSRQNWWPFSKAMLWILPSFTNPPPYKTISSFWPCLAKFHWQKTPIGISTLESPCKWLLSDPDPPLK